MVVVGLLSIAVLALLTVACARIASPRGWASPVLSDDVLLAPHRDELFAFEIDGFKARWAFPVEQDRDDIDPVALYGTPAVAGGAVFVPTHDNTLYAVDIESGELLWSFETDGSLIGGALVVDGIVYFGSDDGNIYALNAETGRPEWQPFKTGEKVQSTPAVAGGTLYATSLDGFLYALDAQTGDELWSFETDGGIPSPPVVDEAAGLVYVAGFDQRLRAIGIESHEEVWSVKAGNWFWTTPLVFNGVVYAGALDGKVYAIEVDTGVELWREPYETEAPIRAAPVIAGGKLIVVDRDGNVHGIDLEEGIDASNGFLPLGDDVLADPLILPSVDGGEAVLFVTTAGDLVQVNPETLALVGRPIVLGD